jgi:hypothetical protein
VTKTLKKEIRLLMFKINPLRINYSIGRLTHNTDMYSILKKHKVSMKFLRHYISAGRISGTHWGAIACFQDLSEAFMSDFQYKLDWMWVCIHQKLSEPFMRKMKNHVKWNYAAENQKMSSDFIIEFCDDINYYCLVKSRHKDMKVLPDTLLYELSIRIDKFVFRETFIKNKKITRARLAEVRHENDWDDRFDILDL